MTSVGSLCSGYTGLEMGVSLVEPTDVAWHAEIEPAACQVLAERFPDVPNLGDIKAVDWTTIEPVDLLCAGYPCQPFSLAGARKGTDDERHVWPAVAEAVRVLRPRRILLENVAGHLSLGFGEVQGGLAALGYDTGWTCLRASDVGAPHRRERVFIAATDTRGPRTGWHGRAVSRAAQEGGWPGAHVRAATHARADAPADAYDAGRSEPRRAGTAEPSHAPTQHRGHASADPRGERRDGWSQVEGAGRRPAIGGEAIHHTGDSAVAWGVYEPAIRRWEQLTRPAPSPVDDRGLLSPAFVEWMMGLPPGWVTDVDIPRTAQLRVLGAGVVPQQAAAAWSLLTEAQEAA